MSNAINSELEASGVAQVMVFMKQADTSAATRATTAGTRTSANALKKHFTQPRTAANSQIARSARRDNTDRISAGAATMDAPRLSVTQTGAIYFPHLGILLGTATKESIAALRKEPGVRKVTGAPQIGLIKPRRTESAALDTGITWGIEALGAKELWDQGLTGKGVLVGHLDTGADGQHPALKNAIKNFAEFDALGRQITPPPAAYDSGDHGTHTAATIAGRPIGGRYMGVAYEADLASAMVIENGNVIARILGGMDWAVEQQVRVLSMSLGLRGWHKDFLELTDLLRNNGILPVYASGNEGEGFSRSPGNYPNALSVGASDADGHVADFSSSQLFDREDPLIPDLVGPGVNVISAKPGGGWASMDGTSMATPHIAGLAALLFQAKPQATVDQVEQAIFASCQLTSGMTKDRANRGLPNAAKALAHL